MATPEEGLGSCCCRGPERSLLGAESPTRPSWLGELIGAEGSDAPPSCQATLAGEVERCVGLSALIRGTEPSQKRCVRSRITAMTLARPTKAAVRLGAFRTRYRAGAS